jgi:bifunctional non-homologous end joining protein LigD
MIDPLQTQFTDNLVGAHGEVKHLPYGDGTLRIGPLVEAALDAGLRMVVISEAREQASHDAIRDELRAALDRHRHDTDTDTERPVASGLVDFPEPVLAEPSGDGFRARTRRPLRLTNLDKPFFPDGITKGDLVQYYASVSEFLLPHLDGRPLSMSRYPEGWDGPSFYEKRAPSHRPEWMQTVPVPSESMGGTVDFLAADSREALMWLANMGCIEVHPFHARAGRLDTPDWAVFDLDPAEGSTWDQVVSAARLLGVALDRLGLESRPKLSGARGIHVYVPLAPVHSFRRVRRFVEAVGRLLVRANPDDLTMEWEIPRRAGKVFVDHNRNASGQTVASVYSVRPRPGAPVSAPIAWEELDTLRNGDVHIGNLWDRLHHHGDLFAAVLGGRQRLDGVEAALGLEPGEPA